MTTTMPSTKPGITRKPSVLRQRSTSPNNNNSKRNRFALILACGIALTTTTAMLRDPILSVTNASRSRSRSRSPRSKPAWRSQSQEDRLRACTDRLHEEAEQDGGRAKIRRDRMAEERLVYASTLYQETEAQAEQICKSLGMTWPPLRTISSPIKDHNWQSYNPEQGWHADPAALVWSWYRVDVSGTSEYNGIVTSRTSASSGVSDGCATHDADKVEVGDEVYVPKYKHNNPWIVKKKCQDIITLTSSPHSIDPEHPRDIDSCMRMFNVSARDIAHDRTVARKDLKHHRRELNPGNFFDRYGPAE